MSWDLQNLPAAGEALTWHIHEKWISASDAAEGAGCGAAVAGNHFDPTVACGPKSGNSLCVASGGCVQKPIAEYNCSSYATKTWSCEVGDCGTRSSTNA